MCNRASGMSHSSEVMCPRRHCHETVYHLRVEQEGPSDGPKPVQVFLCQFGLAPDQVEEDTQELVDLSQFTFWNVDDETQNLSKLE